MIVVLHGTCKQQQQQQQHLLAHPLVHSSYLKAIAIIILVRSIAVGIIILDRLFEM